MSDQTPHDDYAVIADVYDLWSADMDVDIPFYVEAARASGGPVLEVGVGTGRVAVAMAQVGVDVVGIDISPTMLDRARRRVAAEGLDDRVRLLEADMRTADLGETFPLAVLPYRVIAHALTTEDLVDTLSTVRDHLAPNGRIVLSIPVPEASDLAPSTALEYEGEYPLEDGSRAVLWRTSTYEPGTQLLTFRFVVDHLGDDDEVVRRVHGATTLRQNSPGELDLALRVAGFDVDVRHGWFDGREFGPRSREYIVEASRRDGWRRG